MPVDELSAEQRQEEEASGQKIEIFSIDIDIAEHVLQETFRTSINRRRHAAGGMSLPGQEHACWKCGSTEHYVRNCLVPKACFICKFRGHIAKDCPKASGRGN